MGPKGAKQKEPKKKGIQDKKNSLIFIIYFLHHDDAVPMNLPDYIKIIHFTLDPAIF